MKKESDLNRNISRKFLLILYQKDDAIINEMPSSAEVWNLPLIAWGIPGISIYHAKTLQLIHFEPGAWNQRHGTLSLFVYSSAYVTSLGVLMSMVEYPNFKLMELYCRIRKKLTICLKFQLTKLSTLRMLEIAICWASEWNFEGKAPSWTYLSARESCSSVMLTNSKNSGGIVVGNSRISSGACWSSPMVTSDKTIMNFPCLAC